MTFPTASEIRTLTYAEDDIFNIRKKLSYIRKEIEEAAFLGQTSINFSCFGDVNIIITKLENLGYKVIHHKSTNTGYITIDWK